MLTQLHPLPPNPLLVQVDQTAVIGKEENVIVVQIVVSLTTRLGKEPQPPASKPHHVLPPVASQTLIQHQETEFAPVRLRLHSMHITRTTTQIKFLKTLQ